MAMKPPSDRTRWQMLTFLVGAVSVTGRLEGGRPQSLLIVGPPSSGKSALLERYLPEEGSSFNHHLAFSTSISQWGVRKVLERQVPRVTHLVVPEFQSLTLHKKTVWESLLGILLPAMEEGVKDFYAGPKLEQYHGKRLGLITSVATKAFHDVQTQLDSTGFLSRVLVVYLNRTPVDALQARRCYNTGDHIELQKVHVPLPNRPITVRISARLADRIDVYAHNINAGEVHRVGNRFQSLVRAVAWLNGSSEATDKHWDFLRRAEGLWLDEA